MNPSLTTAKPTAGRGGLTSWRVVRIVAGSFILLSP